MPHQGRQVLVVDDEPGIRDMVAGQLARHGYAVVQAGNGREALDQVERHDFDVLLIDLMMPVIDGNELIRQLRRAGRRQAIIVLTGFPDRLAEECRGEVHAVFDKPFQAAALVAAVDNALKLAGRSPPL